MIGISTLTLKSVLKTSKQPFTLLLVWTLQKSFAASCQIGCWFSDQSSPKNQLSSVQIKSVHRMQMSPRGQHGSLPKRTAPSPRSSQITARPPPVSSAHIITWQSPIWLITCCCGCCAETRARNLQHGDVLVDRFLFGHGLDLFGSHVRQLLILAAHHRATSCEGS